MDIQGMFFSPWELDAEGYGPNVGAYYISIRNPAPEGVAYKALNRYKGKNNAGVLARNYLESLGYDGVNNSDEEYIAFYPEQIKSATDNVGTFDKNNPDIRYSLKEQAAANPNAGMSRENARKYGLKNSEYRLMDAFGRVTGYTVEMVDTLTAANGQGGNGRIVGNTIQVARDSSDPYLVAALHETIHSVKDVDPDAYDLLEAFVLRNQSAEQQAYNEKYLKAQ